MQPNNVPSWTIESQTEQLKIDPQGRPIDTVVIGFVTGLGNHGTVTLGMDQYHNTELVRQTIAAEAAHRDSISQLSG